MSSASPGSLLKTGLSCGIPANVMFTFLPDRVAPWQSPSRRLVGKGLTACVGILRHDLLTLLVVGKLPLCALVALYAL